MGPACAGMTENPQKLLPRLYSVSYLTSNKEVIMSVNLSLNIGPLLSLIAGVLILIVPRLLNYIVAVYLIAIGLIGLFGL